MLDPSQNFLLIISKYFRFHQRFSQKDFQNYFSKHFGGKYFTHYAPTKSAIENLTIGLSRELSEKKIRVVCVAPGVINTKLENRTDPIRVAFIGCGKFISMFLAQYNHLNKIEIDSIIDINNAIYFDFI